MRVLTIIIIFFQGYWKVLDDPFYAVCESSCELRHGQALNLPNYRSRCTPEFDLQAEIFHIYFVPFMKEPGCL